MFLFQQFDSGEFPIKTNRNKYKKEKWSEEKKNSNARTREQNANFYTLIVYRSVQSIEKKNTKQKKSTEMQIKFECWKLVENDGKMCIILHRLHALNIHLNRHFVSTTDFWTFYSPCICMVPLAIFLSNRHKYDTSYRIVNSECDEHWALNSHSYIRIYIYRSSPPKIRFSQIHFSSPFPLIFSFFAEYCWTLFFKGCAVGFGSNIAEKNTRYS